jgi:hypothetical protein
MDMAENRRRRKIHFETDIEDNKLSVASKYTDGESGIGGSLCVDNQRPEISYIDLYAEDGERRGGVGADVNGSYFFYKPNSWYGKFLERIVKFCLRRDQLKIYFKEL